MANLPAPLEFHKLTDFASFRAALGIAIHPNQLSYVFQYLTAAEVGVKSVIVEPTYFDRDYLSEFSAFYSLSAMGYPNYCRRAHFFSEEIDRAMFLEAAAGTKAVIERMQAAYQGFSVIRPIESAPLGRTVLAWYKDKFRKTNPRVVKPSRFYTCNLCGIKLRVFGLAWQQQDQGVSACATIGLWTMLHSSAFNERYSIPTTVGITQAANKNSLGLRTFPSRHLYPQQVCEAIKEFGLAPYLVEGDDHPVNGSVYAKTFSKAKLCNTLASMVRSGFPCVIVGEVVRPVPENKTPTRGGHLNVCVGYRAKSTIDPSQMYADGDLEALYIHDDNIGPAVRFTIGHYDATNLIKSDNPNFPICLIPDNPKTGENDAARTYGFFVPGFILAAVESDLRTSAEALIQKAIDIRYRIATVAFADAGSRHTTIPTLRLGIQYSTVANYMGAMLRSRLRSQPKLLATVRLLLQETVRPMSLYVGVVRIGDENGALFDVLYDTTDSDVNHPVFATICYDGVYAGYVGIWDKASRGLFGKIIPAY